MFNAAAVGIASLVLAAAAVGTGSANAATLQAGPSLQVRHADLDLTRAHDVARLNQRIARAARTVCGNADLRDLGAMAAMNKCRVVAVANAAAGVELAVARANRGSALASALPTGTISVP